MPEDRTLSMDSIVSAVGGQLSADLDRETVILHLESGTYYGLSNVGARIWNLIQAPRLVSDVQNALLEEYDAEPAECERDVLALLSDLKAHKLIDIRTQPVPNGHPIAVSCESM